MDGTVYKRKNGKWCYQIPLGKDANGKRPKLTKGGFRTKREAETAKNEKLLELAKASPAALVSQTLGQYLEAWLSRHAERNCGRKTLQRYAELIGYLHETVLTTELREVSPIQLETEFYRLLDEGGRQRKTKKPRPLSAHTVHHVAALVSSAMSDAERLDVIARNPVKRCKLPPVEPQEKAILEPEQLQAFVVSVEGSALRSFIILASATGLRRGELLALTWSDVNSRRRLLSVTKSLEQTKEGLSLKAPKNGKSREVPMPETAVAVLSRHRIDQEEERKMFGDAYRSELDLVFCAPGGDYRKPDTVTAEVCRLAKKAGLKGISLHSLRHSYGSYLLSRGVSLPTVSRLLGHSSPRVTAEVYSHALASDMTAAAGEWEAFMGPILNASELPQ